MKYLEVGQILTTFGIKGEVKVKISSSNPLERFRVGNTLYILNNNEYQKITIDSFRIHKGMALISFNNIKNINDVLSFIDKKIYVNKDELEKLDNDNYYFDDLIGLKAIDKGNVVGEVVDILEVPQGAILVIKKSDNKEAMVPFVNEFVKEVDLENKTINLDLIEGLL